MFIERLHLLKNILLSRLNPERKSLFWATLYPNYHCNFRCRHCYGKYGDNYGSKKTDGSILDIEKYDFILKKLKQYNCRYLSLLGGEPMLHDEIGTIIRSGRDAGMEVSMVTNGSLFERKYDDVKNSSILTVSIDGDKEPNDFLRGKGAYERSLRAVKKIKKSGISVHISATVYRKSIREIDRLFDFAKENRVYVGFCPLMYQSYTDDDSEYLRPSDQDYRTFYKHILDLKKKNYPIIFSNEAYRKIMNWPDFNNVILWNDDPVELESIGFPKCYAGDHYVYIGVTGDVYPCSQLVGSKEFTPKNIFKDGFEEAWDHASHKPCKACTCIGFLDTNMIIEMNARVLASTVVSTMKDIVYRKK